MRSQTFESIWYHSAVAPYLAKHLAEELDDLPRKILGSHGFPSVMARKANEKKGRVIISWMYASHLPSLGRRRKPGILARGIVRRQSNRKTEIPLDSSTGLQVR